MKKKIYTNHLQNLRLHRILNIATKKNDLNVVKPALKGTSI